MNRRLFLTGVAVGASALALPALATPTGFDFDLIQYLADYYAEVVLENFNRFVPATAAISRDLYWSRMQVGPATKFKDVLEYQVKPSAEHIASLLNKHTVVQTTAPPPSGENVWTAIACRSGFNVRVEVGYDKAQDRYEIVFNTFAKAV